MATTSIPAWQTPRLDYSTSDGVSNKDFNRIEGNILNLRNAGPFAVTTGSGNAYEATITDIPTLEIGLGIRLQINRTNTGSSTLNLNNLGAKPIVKNDLNVLEPNDMKQSQILDLFYTGTSWQIVGATQFTPVANVNDIYQQMPHSVFASYASGKYTVTVPNLVLQDGVTILFFRTNSYVTASEKLVVNGIEYPIKNQVIVDNTGTSQDVNGSRRDVAANITYILVFRGSYWEVVDSHTWVALQEYMASTNTFLSKIIQQLNDTVQTMNFNISTSSWSSVTMEDLKYRAYVTWSAVTSTDTVDALFSPQSYTTAQVIGGVVEAVSGGVWIYAYDKPTGSVSGTLRLVRP